MTWLNTWTNPKQKTSNFFLCFSVASFSRRFRIINNDTTLHALHDMNDMMKPCMHNSDHKWFVCLWKFLRRKKIFQWTLRKIIHLKLKNISNISMKEFSQLLRMASSIHQFHYFCMNNQRSNFSFARVFINKYTLAWCLLHLRRKSGKKINLSESHRGEHLSFFFLFLIEKTFHKFIFLGDCQW